MTANPWLNSFKEAWEMLLNIPLPAALFGKADQDQEDKQLLACFPLVGAAVGIAMYTVAWVVTFFFPVSAAAAVIGSILLALISESISTGGNIATLTSFIHARRQKLSVSDMVSSMEQGHSQNNPSEQMFFLSLYLLKLFCIGLLIYHARTSWLIIVFTMSYLIRSQMATWNDLRTSQPFIETEDEIDSLRVPWTLAIVIIFITGISYLPAVVIIAIIAYFMLKYFRKITDRELGGVNGLIIGTAGAAAELIFLIAGIAMLRQ